MANIMKSRVRVLGEIVRLCHDMVDGGDGAPVGGRYH